MGQTEHGRPADFSLQIAYTHPGDLRQNPHLAIVARHKGNVTVVSDLKYDLAENVVVM